MSSIDHQRLDKIVADARKAADTRAEGYRERALKIYPWICGRCAREFTVTNLRELTVHHRDHNHDNNPNDGSNWELLCIYCHDHEHEKTLLGGYYEGARAQKENLKPSIFSQFSVLDSLLPSEPPNDEKPNG